MAKLKLGAIAEDKPVRTTVELPAQVHRDLIDYATALARETGQPVEPMKLVAPMLAKFMATDRGFAAARRTQRAAADPPALSRGPASSGEHATSSESA